MSDFTRNKIAFAVALLAVLFTLNPIIDLIGTFGFSFAGQFLTVSLLYYLLLSLLGLSVYFFGVQFLVERPMPIFQRVGDISYAASLILPPLYAGAYVLKLVVDWVGQLLVLNSGLVLLVSNLITAAGALIASGYLTRLTRSLDRNERKAQSQALQQDELTTLQNARRLLDDNYPDLAAQESYKALEMALRRILATKDVNLQQPNFVLIREAMSLGLLPPELSSDLDDLRQLRNRVAHGHGSATKEEAEKALALVDRALSILSSTSVTSPDQAAKESELEELERRASREFEITDKNFDNSTDPQKIIIEFSNRGNEDIRIEKVKYAQTGLGLPASALLKTYKLEDSGHYTIITFDTDTSLVKPGRKFYVELLMADKLSTSNINRWSGKWGYLKPEVVYSGQRLELFYSI